MCTVNAIGFCIILSQQPRLKRASNFEEFTQALETEIQVRHGWYCCRYSGQMSKSQRISDKTIEADDDHISIYVDSQLHGYPGLAKLRANISKETVENAK